MGDTTKEQMIQAIYGQESSSGKADTSKENYAGARGPMQVTRDTFTGMQRNGSIPADWRHDNPAHTKAAGETLVGQLFDQYGGDPRKVAAAYYAGPKAVRADGTINDFRDKKNPNAPTTLQYADQVLARLGAVTEMPATSAPREAEVTPDGQDPLNRTPSNWGNAMPDLLAAKQGRPAKVVKDKSLDPIGATPPLTGEGVTPLSETVRARGDAATAENQRKADTSFLQIAKDASTYHTFYGALYRKEILNDLDRDNVPQLGYQVDPKELEGKSQDEQEFLLSAHSPAHLEILKSDVQMHREYTEEIASRGTAVAMAATVVAGLPEDVTLGMGAYNIMRAARVGSALKAAQGARGAAILSSAVENIGANLAITAAQESVDPYLSGAAPYVSAVAGGLLGVGMTAPGIFREAAHAQARGMIASAAEAEARLQVKAIENVGPGTAPEVLHAEIKRLEVEEIRAVTAPARAEIPETHRLLPEDENLRTDALTSGDGNVAVAESALNRQKFGEGVTVQWDDPAFLANRMRGMTENPAWARGVEKLTHGEMTYAKALELPDGVTVLPHLAHEKSLVNSVATVNELVAKYLPGQKVVLSAGSVLENAAAEIITAGRVHFIAVKPGLGQVADRHVVHEVGHAVFRSAIQDAPPELLRRLKADHASFLRELAAGSEESVTRRVSPTHQNADAKGLKGNAYSASFDEYAAEQFVKHVEKRAGEAGSGYSPGLIERITGAVRQVMDFFMEAKAKKLLTPDDSFNDFFKGVLEGNLKQAKHVQEEFLAPDLVFPTSFSKDLDTVSGKLHADPLARKLGVDIMPMRTAAEQAEAQAIVDLHRKAESANYRVDEKRLSRLLETAPFQGAQATSNTLARSQNPVARMVAAELLESPSGSLGRRSNAAIAKHIKHQELLGNTMNEFQSVYAQYRKANGGTVAGDAFNGKQWEQFNRSVMEEIESRRAGAAPIESNPMVKAAADILEPAYERMRLSQVEAKTVGWASLPESSKGYVPHRLSTEKFLNMSHEQLRAMHQALTDQFIRINGFDLSFSDALASKYLDRVRVRAQGGFDSPGNIHQVGAADVVEDALRAMGMETEQVRAMMGKYMAGGAAHTKKRLNLDLNQEHVLEDGSTFRLMDLYETDQFKLLRGQAGRVSGEVALARHGVMGNGGLKLLRRSMEFGEARATARELEAFDQVAAEFMGQPFGTQNQMLDRVMSLNSISRLGGMGFTQMAEAINGIWHVGVLKSLEAVGSFGRLRSEIKAIARGEAVDNKILGSLEKDGAEFGTQDYKTVFPFDSPSLEHATYGKDTINMADRLLRGGAHLQAKLSLWKTVHSTQQRGFAEQIVRKAAQYLRDGKSGDKALKDMGFTDELMGRLRKDLDNMAEFKGDHLTNFDITKSTDKEAADAFVQNIHRGVSQIIQETFIGERGRWAHDATMKFMTQFRTFSITSVEKQWVRQLGNREGNETWRTAKVLGMMLGSMSIAAPIYMTRVHAASIGRPDREEYLDKMLAPEQIARATMNYVAQTGLAGDLIDLTSAVAGHQVTGGRAGQGSGFVGTAVAPSVGLVEDLWKGVQNTKEGTNPSQVIKSLPFSRLPLVIPAINALTAE